MTSPITPVYGPCGKRIYASKDVGKRLARRVNDSGKSRVQPYHCTRCHGWHLGHSNRYQAAVAHRQRRRQED